MNVSMHEYICSHTHTHTHVPHIDFHCNTGGVAPPCTYTACGMSGATNTSRVHSKSEGGGGVYIIIGDQTLPKGGVSPRKVPPLSHTSYWISRPFGLDSAVTAFRAVTLGAAWDVGMACNVFKLLELLWPHPPDVQACTSLYAVNSCSPYTVYGIGQGRDLPLPPPIHPLVCP